MKSRAVDVVLVVALLAVVFIMGGRVRATQEGGQDAAVIAPAVALRA